MTTPKDVQILFLIEAEATIEETRERWMRCYRARQVSDKVRQNWAIPLVFDASRALCRELHRIGMWQEIYGEG